MGTWISNIPLKYKFWAVNAVAFFTTLLLVLFAMQQEAAGRNASAQSAAAAEGELVQAWPTGGTLPARSNLLPLEQAASLGGTAAQALDEARGWVELDGAERGLAPVCGELLP
ncbi:methyl-accepting chemotaxis protein, partial [Pseudomonas aeruginosa]|nr:methyl-accepting chemotaxis protein [Pseudomonas aeruginosa]